MKVKLLLVITLLLNLSTFSQDILKNKTLKPILIEKDSIKYLAFKESQSKALAKKMIGYDSCVSRENNYLEIIKNEKKRNVLADSSISTLNISLSKKDTTIKLLEEASIKDSVAIEIGKKNEKLLKKELRKKGIAKTIWQISTFTLAGIIIYLLISTH